MSYILTIHNKSLIESLFEKTGKEYKQFVYKYDDCIGIYNQLNNSFIAFKSEPIDINSSFLFEKQIKQPHNNPPVCIDDLYYENVNQTDNYKIIGTKDNYIVQFEFNHKDFNKFMTMFQTVYKSLFEKLDLTTLKKYFESCDKSSAIDYKKEEIVKDIIMKPIVMKSSTSSKPSKYQTKNTTKYEPKRYTGIIETVPKKHYEHHKRFDSKISFVTRVDSK